MFWTRKLAEVNKLIHTFFFCFAISLLSVCRLFQMSLLFWHLSFVC
jgi:hypothetical protein